jgi:hypothetical protein
VHVLSNSRSNLLFSLWVISTPAVLAQSSFVRGDCDADGDGDIADGLHLLFGNFAGGVELTCSDACDADDDGSVDGIGDAVYLLLFHFIAGSPPAAPYPDCGLDITLDAVDCEFAPPPCLVGCGLRFTSLPGDLVLIDATGHDGSGPKQVDVELVVFDVNACGDSGDPAVVRVRVGCEPSDSDAECTRVYSATVSQDGQAIFAGVDAIEFFDGEDTTLHGVVVHPGTGEVSATPEKRVLVDPTPPAVTILRPGVNVEETVLSTRDLGPGSDWALGETTMVGPMSFTVEGAPDPSCDGEGSPRSRCSFTVRYASGQVLEDGSGPISGRAISSAAATQIDLIGVRYPTMAGTSGGELEVLVTDAVGNTTTARVPLNVAADRPPSPGSLTIDREPYLPSGGARSGQADLEWSESTDDAAGGSSVLRYEVRAMCS